MSRFAALDLAALPVPSAVRDLDYEAIVTARLAALEAHLAALVTPEQTAEAMALARGVAASPTRYLLEAGAARELYLENRINQAVRGVYLATASGGDLDLIGANRGVVRRAGETPESDDSLRARIQLSMEALSPWGTEGAYVFWALEADPRVADVVVYGPNHALEPPVLPAEPRMVILSREGDGSAGPELLAKVQAHCMADKRRPVGDLLQVQSAEIVPFEVRAVLHVTRAASAAAVQASAEAALARYLDERLRIARPIYRSALAAALSVEGVVDVALLAPEGDLAMGPYQAASCSAVALSVETVVAGWRDV